MTLTRARNAIAIASLSIAGTLLMACDPSQDRVAVRADSSGSVEIHWACGPQRVPKSIAVGVSENEEPGVTRLSILWEIRSSAAAAGAEVYAVGETPEGWEESVALTEPLPTERRLAVKVESRVVDYQWFRLSQLRTTEVFLVDDYRSAEDFRNDSAC